MVNRTLATTAALLCLGLGCDSQTTEHLGGMRGPNLSSQDNNYLRDISESNLTEIQSSQLALNTSASPQVKAFANEMISDHNKAGAEVMSVAQTKSARPPTMLDGSHMDTVDDLKGKSGADFDKAYVTMQVKSHQDAINIDQDEANNGNDPDVKNLASTLLPTLREHLNMAQALQSQMMGS